MKRYRVGIVGATGTVGKKLTELLADHPWFELRVLLASARSSGKSVGGYPIKDIKTELDGLSGEVDFVFCAVNADKEETKRIELALARREIPVVSTASAHRQEADVPVVIPELNPEHLSVIPFQRRRLGTKRGFIAAKCNCSLLSYLPLLFPLRPFGLRKVIVSTYQAVSGAGKTLSSMPELVDNVIPYIDGEEEKSETEPLKILGTVKDGKIVPASAPVFSVQCVRVPVSDGHSAAVSVLFDSSPKKEEILSAWGNFTPEIKRLSLPSAPERFISYLSDRDRPQPALDRDTQNGMGVCVGRLRRDPALDYKFFALSHNLLRGAAGGAVLLAELLAKKGYFQGEEE